MKVLRLYFRNDDPLDVRSEDVVDISPSGYGTSLAVEVTDGPGGGNESLIPERAEFVERSEDSSIDLR